MPCDLKPPCRLSPVPLTSIDVRWDGPAVGRKALAFPEARAIFLDSQFWASLRTIEGRRAILAHEQAHIEGARCESCADHRAGEILREEGYTSPRDGARALMGRLENRDGQRAAKELLDGFGLDAPRALDPAPLGSGGHLLDAQRAEGVGPEIRAALVTLDVYGLKVAGQALPWKVRVPWRGGKRSQAEQDELYAQGRTAPGPIVTWTRASKHLTGDAVDLVPVDPLTGLEVSDVGHPAAAALVEFYKGRGLRSLAPGDWRHAETQVDPRLVATVATVGLVLFAAWVANVG